jgi:hypothetical protein
LAKVTKANQGFNVENVVMGKKIEKFAMSQQEYGE